MQQEISLQDIDLVVVLVCHKEILNVIVFRITYHLLVIRFFSNRNIPMNLIQFLKGERRQAKSNGVVNKQYVYLQVLYLFNV